MTTNETGELSLEDELLNWVKESETDTAMGLAHRHVLREQDPRTVQDVKDILDGLVAEGKLQDLYPRGVNPERAGLSVTYYVAVERD